MIIMLALIIILLTLIQMIMENSIDQNDHNDNIIKRTIMLIMITRMIIVTLSNGDDVASKLEE